MEENTESNDFKLEIFKELDLIRTCTNTTENSECPDESSASRSRSFEQIKLVTSHPNPLPKQDNFLEDSPPFDTSITDHQHEQESMKDGEDLDGNSVNSSETLEAGSEEIVLPSFDGKRLRRNSKRRREEDEHCPVCSLTLRPHELVSHFALEVEKLDKIPKHRMRRKNEDGINTTFVQVRSNRQNRLSAKVAHYTQKAKNEIQCGVCKVRMSGSMEEMNKHVALCTQHEEENEEYVNVEDEEESNDTEEYEFGDETRIRAVSLVPGGHRSLQGGSSRRALETDEDLNVDIDDTVSFGTPQYTEIDLIPNSPNIEGELQDQLRKAVLNDPDVQPKVLESRKWLDNSDAVCEEVEPESDGKDDHVVSSLKDRIKEMEQQNSIKCLICMEPYTKPVVSTTCWHVHCEECWLMTMGVKKLCPQCNMIVFPADLRKIYL